MSAEATLPPRPEVTLTITMPLKAAEQLRVMALTSVGGNSPLVKVDQPDNDHPEFLPTMLTPLNPKPAAFRIQLDFEIDRESAEALSALLDCPFQPDWKRIMTHLRSTCPALDELRVALNKYFTPQDRNNWRGR